MKAIVLRIFLFFLSYQTKVLASENRYHTPKKRNTLSPSCCMCLSVSSLYFPSNIKLLYESYMCVCVCVNIRLGDVGRIFRDDGRDWMVRYEAAIVEKRNLVVKRLLLPLKRCCEGSL